MNGLVITKSILNEIYDDKTFRNEVEELINSLIDSELEKDEPDFDFIDECADVLIEAQNKNYQAVIPFVAKNKFEDEGKKRRVLSVFTACAVVLSLGVGAVALSYTAEKEKEERKAEQMSQTVPVQTEMLETDAETSASSSAVKENIHNAEAVSLNLKFSSAFKTEYKRGEKLNIDGLTVIVKYSDGTSREADISDCRIVTGENFGKSSFLEKVTVEYEGLSKSFFVTFGENVTGSDITPYTGFEKKTEAPKIQTASQYVEVEAGKSICVPMSKNNDGFVICSADSNILDDVTVSYQGGKNGRQIYLNITAGNTPGTTTVSVAYERSPDDIMAQITVKVVEGSEKTDAENIIND